MVSPLRFTLWTGVERLTNLPRGLSPDIERVLGVELSSPELRSRRIERFERPVPPPTGRSAIAAFRTTSAPTLNRCDHREKSLDVDEGGRFLRPGLLRIEGEQVLERVLVLFAIRPGPPHTSISAAPLSPRQT